MFFCFQTRLQKKTQCFRVFFHVCKTPQVFSVFLLRKWHRQVVEILLRHCGSWAVRSPRRTPTFAAPTSCRADSTRRRKRNDLFRRKRSVFGGNYKIQTRKKLKNHIHKQAKMTWKVLRGWFLFVVSRFYCCCRHMHMFSVSFRELFEGISNFRSSKKQKEFVCCLFLVVVPTQGRATYLQVGSSSAIVFRRGFWIIDRNGVPWMCDDSWRKKRRCGRRMTSDGLMVFCSHFVVIESVVSVVLFDHRQTPRHNLSEL